MHRGRDDGCLTAGVECVNHVFDFEACAPPHHPLPCPLHLPLPAPPPAALPLFRDDEPPPPAPLAPPRPLDEGAADAAAAAASSLFFFSRSSFALAASPLFTHSFNPSLDIDRLSGLA